MEKYLKGDFIMNIDELLKEEIEQEFDGLKTIEVGTEEYKTTVDGLAKLVDRAIELKKFDASCAEKESELEIKANELEIREKQAKDDNKDRLIRNGINIAGIIIPTVVTIWGTLKTFKFEEEGSVTTTIGRGFINKLLPKK